MNERPTSCTICGADGPLALIPAPNPQDVEYACSHCIVRSAEDAGEGAPTLLGRPVEMVAPGELPEIGDIVFGNLDDPRDSLQALYEAEQERGT